MPIGFWAVSREQLVEKIHRHSFRHPVIGADVIDKLKLEVEDKLNEALDEAIAFFIVKNRI